MSTDLMSSDWFSSVQHIGLDLSVSFEQQFHQRPQFGAGHGMLPFETRPIRWNPGLDIGGLPEEMLQGGDIQSMSVQMSQQSIVGVAYSGQPVQEYHGHTMPNQGHLWKVARLDEGDATQRAPSMVGMEGMPPPALPSKGPKPKFTPEEDQLLIDLKENKALTWKQIADFFPGRSPGTLQVHYCKKLKANSTQWTDETVSFVAIQTMDTTDRPAGHEASPGLTRLRAGKVADRRTESWQRLHISRV
jgi:hypothetical protein